MTKSGNFDNFGASTLPNAFADLSGDTLQVMASNLMQAVQEAQGLIIDSVNGMDFSKLAPGQADPFGGLETQARLASALIRNPEKSGHAMMTLFQGWMNLFQAMANGTPLPKDR
ncbi:MAG: hypothetical protein AAGB16_03185, partial [Pseudomonadota bacterium]